MSDEKYKEVDKFIELFNEFKNIRQQQKMRGLNDFNIFTTLRGGSSDEVRLHSRFLAFLLDPNEAHYQGTLFLELFLQELELSNFFTDLEHCTVYAEYENIDIYITDGNKHIIIENKIWAGDQHAQIKRYIETINDENEDLSNDDMVVVYLSVNRDKPSNYSLCQDEKDCPNGFYIKNNKIIGKARVNDDNNTGKNEGREYQFINLNYDNQITNWLNKAYNQVRNITNLSVILEQYQEVLLQLYGKYKEKVMDLDEYLKTKENKVGLIKTIKDISEEYIKLKTQMQKDFWKDLLTELGDGYQFGGEYNYDKGLEKSCENYYRKQKNRMNYGIEYIFNNNSKQKLMLIVEEAIYFCLKTNKENQKYVNNQIKKSEAKIGKNGYFYPNIELDFYNFDDESITDLIGKNREKTIQSLAREFKELVEKLENEK